MSGATCATCRHFRPQDGSARGDCWRYPPREGDVSVTTADVCGEHAPTPAVGVPGLPELPQGWEWAGDDYTEARCAAFGLRVMVRGRTGYEVVSIVGNVRADVVEMTIARHRARAGGAA